MARKHALVIPVFLQAHFFGIYRFALEIARRGVTVTLVGSGKLIAIVRSFDDLQGLDFNLVSYQDFGIVEAVPTGNVIADIIQELADARGIFQPVLEKLVADWNGGVPGPTCIIADRFLTWVVDIAKELNIPYYQFFSCGATYVTALQAQVSLIADGTLAMKRDSEGMLHLEEFEGYLNIPGLPPLEFGDFLKTPPADTQIRNAPSTDLEIGQNINEADGVIVNTFYELESPQIDAIQEVWKHLPSGKIPKLYLVGPVSNAASFKDRSLYEAPGKKRGNDSLEWLDRRPPLSVAYI